MKNVMQGCLVAALALAASAAYADPVPPAAPDFLARTSPRVVDPSLALSSGGAPIAPFDDLGFAPNSAALDSAALSQIDAAAHWLRAHPKYRIAVEGHPDLSDSADMALDLATRRANMVRSHLMGWGIGSDRIVVLVSGEPGAHVAIFASDQSVRQIASAAIDTRRVIAAVWTDRGTLIQEEPGAGRKPREVVATRK